MKFISKLISLLNFKQINSNQRKIYFFSLTSHLENEENVPVENSHKGAFYKFPGDKLQFKIYKCLLCNSLYKLILWLFYFILAHSSAIYSLVSTKKLLIRYALSPF